MALQQQQPALQENDLQRQQQLQNLSTSQQQLRVTNRANWKTTAASGEPSLTPDWLLAEADYLVRMAGRKLWLERDATAAQMLLVEAR